MSKNELRNSGERQGRDFAHIVALPQSRSRAANSCGHDLPPGFGFEGAVYVKKYNIEMDNLQGICYKGLRMNVGNCRKRLDNKEEKKWLEK